MLQCGNELCSAATIASNVRRSISLSSYLIDAIVISNISVEDGVNWVEDHGCGVSHGAAAVEIAGH
jgi:hypothetical protein